MKKFDEDSFPVRDVTYTVGGSSFCLFVEFLHRISSSATAAQIEQAHPPKQMSLMISKGAGWVVAPN